MKTSGRIGNGLECYRQLLHLEGEGLLAAVQAELNARVGPGLAAPEDLPPLINRRFVALPISQFDYLRFELIDSVLAHLGSSSDGVCADCGGSISAERLEGVLLANLCLNCQQASGFNERPEPE
jgi:RNA polymerase-binding transcription factor DksA